MDEMTLFVAFRIYSSACVRCPRGIEIWKISVAKHLVSRDAPIGYPYKQRDPNLLESEA